MIKEYKSLVGEYVIEYRTKKHNKIKVRSSDDSQVFARKVWPGGISVRETVIAIMLNRVNNVTGYYIVSQGGIHGTVIDLRIILHVAIQSLSSSFILAHNHPSGNLTPSDADITITKKIVKAADYLEINVLDHIILTEDAYLSFADEGLLTN